MFPKDFGPPYVKMNEKNVSLGRRLAFCSLIINLGICYFMSKGFNAEILRNNAPLEVFQAITVLLPLLLH